MDVVVPIIISRTVPWSKGKAKAKEITDMGLHLVPMEAKVLATLARATGSSRATTRAQAKEDHATDVTTVEAIIMRINAPEALAKEDRFEPWRRYKK